MNIVKRAILFAFKNPTVQCEAGSACVFSTSFHCRDMMCPMSYLTLSTTGRGRLIEATILPNWLIRCLRTYGPPV